MWIKEKRFLFLMACLLISVLLEAQVLPVTAELAERYVTAPWRSSAFTLGEKRVHQQPGHPYYLARVKKDSAGTLRPVASSLIVRQLDKRNFIIRTASPKAETALQDFDLILPANTAWKLSPAISGGLPEEEFRPDSTDIDFRGRYQPSPLSTDLVSTHATTMATMIAGGGNSFSPAGAWPGKPAFPQLVS